jgi:hypothetical protein
MFIYSFYDLLFAACYIIWTHTEAVCLYIAVTNPRVHYHYIHPITLPLWLVCTVGMIIHYF